MCNNDLEKAQASILATIADCGGGHPIAFEILNPVDERLG